MSEDLNLTSVQDKDETTLGHLNLGQEIEDNTSGVTQNEKELPELRQEEIEGEILENDEIQNSEEWWKYVQALVTKEENDSNGHIASRFEFHCF